MLIVVGSIVTTCKQLLAIASCHTMHSYWAHTCLSVSFILLLPLLYILGTCLSVSFILLLPLLLGTKHVS